MGVPRASQPLPTPFAVCLMTAGAERWGVCPSGTGCSDEAGTRSAQSRTVWQHSGGDDGGRHM
eukprot:CAMPEP_0174369836 /NCGR_PEP_ID=MMETSP0811_2-20130205/93906_1 /TAXON_ID=73025 ORGANISM="Eutreptiella gymnastica-like, Strain CCMP1594" /NCGR_SAMPLE_ID=MMETSP0811_2 /ASSEMBLY_ACC=CAM_ASM_000667 /LENGTH=62 /DNA_ID=CAMNT_0015514673 /DNA_START=32 /DNA_END=217 /DNA_ORIENTATION=+